MASPDESANVNVSASSASASSGANGVPEEGSSNGNVPVATDQSDASRQVMSPSVHDKKGSDHQESDSGEEYQNPEEQQRKKRLTARKQVMSSSKMAELMEALEALRHENRQLRSQILDQKNLHRMNQLILMKKISFWNRLTRQLNLMVMRS